MRKSDLRELFSRAMIILDVSHPYEFHCPGEVLILAYKNMTGFSLSNIWRFLRFRFGRAYYINHTINDRSVSLTTRVMLMLDTSKAIASYLCEPSLMVPSLRVDYTISSTRVRSMKLQLLSILSLLDMRLKT